MNRLDQALNRTAQSDTGGSGSGSAGAGAGEGTRTAGELRIEADTVEELKQQRGIIDFTEPQLPRGALQAGQRSLEVRLRFEIIPAGLVRDISFEKSSGYPDVDSAIEKAVRTWKFQPVSTPGNVTVLLRYYISAQ
jgi:TonB family protein